MKPLETSRRVLMWLCGFPPDESAGKWLKIAYVIFTSSIVMDHLLSLIAGAIFIHKNVSSNFEDTLFSLFHTVGSLSMLYQSVVIVFMRRNLTAIFEELSRIYNESK